MSNKIEFRVCKYCSETFETNKSGLTYHENRCEKNPDKRTVSEETRQKIALANERRTNLKKGKKKNFQVLFQLKEHNTH